MLVLNKVLPIFALPLGVVFLLLSVALLRRRFWPAVIAIGVLYISSTGVVGSCLLGYLEAQYAAVPIAKVGKADAIVVLGGISGPPSRPGYLENTSEAHERIDAGVVLLKTGAAPWLVFTGARLPWDTYSRIEGEDSRDAALARDIPAAKILITREVGNTADEAQAVAELVRSRNWKRIILVTTSSHMPRAAWLFRRAGVECTVFPVDFRVNPEQPYTFFDFLPNGGALSDTETALREIYGNLFYRIFR